MQIGAQQVRRYATGGSDGLYALSRDALPLGNGLLGDPKGECDPRGKAELIANEVHAVLHTRSLARFKSQV